MYLTRMHLNPARRGTRHLLASPQRMHAAVLGAFPPGGSGGEDEGRILWRVDRGEPPSYTLYISSPTRPDLTHVVEQAGWPAGSETWQTVDATPLLERLEPGQEWVFRLTANPVRSERNPDGGRGKRYGHVTASQQEDWLRTKATAWGFQVVEAVARDRRQARFRRATGSDRPVTLTVVTFDGLLQITDPVAFRASLTTGLGRAKGYGCGLITLAPR